VAVKKPEI